MSGNKLDLFFEGVHNGYKIRICIYNGYNTLSDKTFVTSSISKGESGLHFAQTTIMSIDKAMHEHLVDVKTNRRKKISDEALNSLEEFCALVEILLMTGGFDE